MLPSGDNALVLFPGALGDFVCFLPALCGLRARHHGRMLLVAQATFADLLRMRDGAAISIDRREIADLFSLGPLAPHTTTLLGGFAHVYSWTGFGNPEFARRLAAATGGQVGVYGFRRMQSGEHATEYYARCVGVAADASAAPALAADAHWLAAFEREHRLANRRILLMHPSSGAPHKNWQGFASVARQWRDHHDDALVVLAGPAEIDRPMVINEATIAVDGLSLPQVASLLRRSRLYLGNDSGISHLAGVLGVRGVVLFGSTDPATWAPRAPGLRILHAPAACDACGFEEFCVHRLPPASVVRALVAADVGRSIES